MMSIEEALRARPRSVGQEQIENLTKAQREQIQAINVRKIQGVYDLAQYGYDLKFRAIDAALSLANVTTFTYSTGISEAQVNDEDFTPSGAGSVSYQTMLHSLDSSIHSNDTVAIVHAGNNTAFSRNYLAEPDMTAELHQLQVLMCFALNCSAYTNGSLNITSVKFTLQSFLNNNQPLSKADATVEPSTAFTALTGTGLQLFFVRAFVDPKMKVWANAPIVMNVAINTAISGTNTYQLGYLPQFSYIKNNIMKEWFVSQINGHIHPLPEHGDEVAKDTDVGIKGITSE